METEIKYSIFDEVKGFIVNDFTKDLLLEVATEIDTQEDYCGRGWKNDNGSGCAIFQLAVKINNSVVLFDVTDLLGEKTSIPAIIWERFTPLTLSLDGPTVATVLREFTEGKFDNRILRMGAY
jgi:hypothetical protein